MIFDDYMKNKKFFQNPKPCEYRIYLMLKMLGLYTILCVMDDKEKSIYKPQPSINIKRLMESFRDYGLVVML